VKAIKQSSAGIEDIHSLTHSCKASTVHSLPIRSLSCVSYVLPTLARADGSPTTLPIHQTSPPARRRLWGKCRVSRLTGTCLPFRKCLGMSEPSITLRVVNLSCTSNSSIEEDSYTRRPSAASSSSTSSNSFARSGDQTTRYPGAALPQQHPSTNHTSPQSRSMQPQFQRQVSNHPPGFARGHSGPQQRSQQSQDPSMILHNRRPSAYSTVPVAQTQPGVSSGGAGPQGGAAPGNTKKQQDEDAELAERMMDW